MMRQVTALIGSTVVGSIFASAAAFGAGPKSPGEQASWDSQITTAVEAQIAADRAMQGENIRVKTENGVVELYGSVDTTAQKQEAEEQARTVNGVIDVHNDLDVKP